MTFMRGVGPRYPGKAGELRVPAAASASSVAPKLTSTKSPPGNAADQIASFQAATTVVGAGPPRSLRILIVEDDLAIGPLLAEVLNDLGHTVCAIETNANAAVTAARFYCPDLMIVDVKLGGSSGVSAVREIQGEGIVPHVFVTGDALQGLPIGSGAVLLQKPYRPSDLITAIEAALAATAAYVEAPGKGSGRDDAARNQI